jgi:hypothetical protein
MIHAGVSELRRALVRHHGAAQTRSESAYLLLFYAAECGLKAAWLKRNRLRTTAQVDLDLITKSGHDLRRWVRELHLPAALGEATVHFHLRSSGSAYDVSLAHQAWRYGIDIDVDDEAGLVVWLQALCDWAKKEMAL